MACKTCGLDIPTSPCEVCRYLSEEHHIHLPALCEHCGFPMVDPSEYETLCKLCNALLANVRARAWFVAARTEWERENIELARLKRELLGQGLQPAS